jgi:hypothetical protein
VISAVLSSRPHPVENEFGRHLAEYAKTVCESEACMLIRAVQEGLSDRGKSIEEHKLFLIQSPLNIV